MKKILIVLFLIPIFSFGQAKKKAKAAVKTKTTITKTSATPPPASVAPALLDISGGLKEALTNGVTKEVSKLTAVDGFFKNENVKILLPEELSTMEATLRKFGMDKYADDAILSINRAAEDAVKEATPIFINAIKIMNIADAKSILTGSENAATSYLQTVTTKELYAKFSPVVQQSIGKVGADVVWTSMINKYNKIPLVSKVNPDITDYVTNKALEGVFKMITVEEKNIRANLKSRTSPLLQSVFGLLDKK